MQEPYTNYPRGDYYSIHISEKLESQIQDICYRFRINNNPDDVEPVLLLSSYDAQTNTLDLHSAAEPYVYLDAQQIESYNKSTESKRAEWEKAKRAEDDAREQQRKEEENERQQNQWQQPKTKHTYSAMANNSNQFAQGAMVGVASGLALGSMLKR